MLRRPIFLILAFIVLLFLFGWIIFSIPWGGTEEKKTEETTQQTQFTDYYNTDTKVRINENGAIVGDEEHREVWITVGRSEVTAEIKQGYEGTTLKSTRMANNEVAYRAFLSGLEGLGFTKTRDYKGDQTETGACPDGVRYIFEVYNSTGNIMRSWAGSCNSKVGTFDGRLTDVRQLFEAQVPNYNDFVADVDLT